jgi:kynurenine formamidase
MIDLTAPLDSYGFEPGITHMDLYYKDRRCPDTSLITDCVAIDLINRPAGAGPDAVPELAQVERGNSVILKTGWEKHRGTPEYDNSPSASWDLVRALVAKGVALVLIDSPGVCGGARGPEHNRMDQYLADNEAYAVENLVNVHQLPVHKFRLYCFPIQLSAMNTAPCRVVADI